MRRCANGGLSHDENNETTDPDVVRDLLGRLARLTGHPTLDVFFGLSLESILIPEEMERLRLRRHIFLARYGRQSVLQWRDIDGREVRAYAEALANFLREENDAVQAATKRREEE